MVYPGKIRIIAGQFRGRYISVLENESLRPTPSRVRETVFNWLQSKIVGARCLDCFSGTGILGFEALSRGAKEVTLLEKAMDMSQGLKKTRADWKVDEKQCHIVHQDALYWLSQEAQSKTVIPYDVIFLDPPYGSDLLARCLDVLQNSPLLAPDAWIYVEMPARTALPSNGWTAFKSKVAGQVGYHLLTKA